jgi:hypothetical protein
MAEWPAAGASAAWARRFLVAASVAAVALSLPVHASAQVVQPDTPQVEAALPGWRHSLTKALSYQTIVVTTDQLLYWTIVTGTAASEWEFLASNAVTGIGYYVLFDEAWTGAGLDPAPGNSQVSLTKAIAYRVFDTARVLGVTLAIGTPLTASLEVTAAIAATRTAIYVLHDYAWSWVDGTR